MFNPAESIDFTGNTGPFVQYTHARIQSVLRKSKEMNFDAWDNQLSVNEKEKSLMKLIYNYPDVITNASLNYSPAQIASFAFDLAKEYNQFYHDNMILQETDRVKASFRLDLSELTAKIIKSSMYLLGIEVPNRM